MTANMANNIQYGMTSHYPSMSGRATAKSLEGMVTRVIGFHHLHTQHFTMEGVQRGRFRYCLKGAKPGPKGTSVPTIV